MAIGNRRSDVHFASLFLHALGIVRMSPRFCFVSFVSGLDKTIRRSARVFGRMAICLPHSFFEPYDGRKFLRSYYGTRTSAPSIGCRHSAHARPILWQRQHEPIAVTDSQAST